MIPGQPWRTAENHYTDFRHAKARVKDEGHRHLNKRYTSRSFKQVIVPCQHIFIRYFEPFGHSRRKCRGGDYRCKTRLSIRILKNTSPFGCVCLSSTTLPSAPLRKAAATTATTHSTPPHLSRTRLDRFAAERFQCVAFQRLDGVLDGAAAACIHFDTGSA